MAALIVVSPGPDMALVVRNTLITGRRAGVGTVLGITCGIAAWAIAAAVGLAAVLERSAIAFTAIKVAGGVYLVVLGMLTLRHRQPSAVGRTGGARLTIRRAWTLGWLSASLNPKLGIFFLTLLPQFVQPGMDQPVRLLALAGVFGVLGLTWLLLVVEVVARARSAVVRPRVACAMRWVMGMVLIGLGIRVVLARD
ncbi:MAG: LysE family translocator [Chloroflexota bacterium]